MSTETKTGVEFLKAAPEMELRGYEVATPKSEAELLAMVQALAERQHDYGTCVYAMSIAAVAAFNYVAHKLGVTGFQASAADMDILRRTRGFEHGFRIIDNANLLYPQYDDKLRVSPETLLADEGLRKGICKAAREKLEQHPNGVHESVYAHWQKLAAMEPAKPVEAPQ